MPAVNAFALYAGMALLMDFLLQMTCFIALLSLDTARQEVSTLKIPKMLALQQRKKCETNSDLPNLLQLVERSF